MVTVEKSAVIGCSTVPDIPKFIDIDSNDKDPLLCCLYAPEIYYNMRVSEVIPRLYSLYRNLVSQRVESLIPCASVSLLFLQLKRRPFPDFMERIQKDVTQSMRGILVDWLVEVSV